MEVNMHKQIIVILSLVLAVVMASSAFATLTRGDASGMGDLSLDGSVNGSRSTDPTGPVDGSGPADDTGAMYDDTTEDTGGRWVGIVIALIIAAALIAAVAFILPRRRR